VDLVGRHAELAEVDGLLERTASGTGALLVLVGAKGSGKTALIAAANAARDRGFSVVGIG
jgi:predicted ATPase